MRDDHLPANGQSGVEGIDTEFATLQQAVPFLSSTRYAVCSAQHQWSRSDACICETISLERPSAA
jgi:hypothetical protein